MCTKMSHKKQGYIWTRVSVINVTQVRVGTAKDRGLIPDRIKKNSSLPENSQTGSITYPASSSECWRDSAGKSRPGLEADKSPLHNADIKNV